MSLKLKGEVLAGETGLHAMGTDTAEAMGRERYPEQSAQEHQDLKSEQRWRIQGKLPAKVNVEGRERHKVRASSEEKDDVLKGKMCSALSTASYKLTKVKN